MSTEDAKPSGFSRFDISYGFAFWFIAAYIVLAAAEGLAILWRPLGISAYSLLILIAIAWAAYLVFEPIGSDRVDANTFGSAPSALVILVVAFCELCRLLALSVGGFTSQGTGYWHWLRYGASWALDNGLFNASEIFDWHLSEIHATVAWSRFLVLAFNVALEVLAIAAILRYASFFWKKRNEATAEVPQSGHVAYLMSRLGRLLLAAIWLAPTLVFIGAIAEDGLALDATWSATRAILPVFLGAWLTWQSLLALFRLAGWGNKVLALFSIAVAPRLFTLPAPPCWRTLAGKAPNTSPGHATTSMLWSHPCRERLAYLPNFLWQSDTSFLRAIGNWYQGKPLELWA